MKVTITVIVGICAAFLGYFASGFINSNSSSASLAKLDMARRAVEKSIGLLSNDINKKLDAFSRTVSEDHVFTLRLLAEKDKSSPDITGFAARFLGPMGFSILDITDSSYVVISSGQFTANAGANVSVKASAVGTSPVAIRDNIKGDAVLTFQAKKEFRIADIPFFVFGGFNIDRDILMKLSPFDGCMVLMRIGNEIIGMNAVHSVSEIKENKMIINDKEYFAVSVAIPFAGEGTAPEILVVIKK